MKVVEITRQFLYNRNHKLSLCVFGVCETILKFATTFLLQIQSFDISHAHILMDELFKFTNIYNLYLGYLFENKLRIVQL